MSLRGFHIVFIILAVLVTLLFAWWALYTNEGLNSGAAVRWCGIASGVLGVFLAIYGTWFIRVKRKKIII